MKTIGERLEHYKREKGLTYKDYASELGINPDAIRVAITTNKVKPIYINLLSEKFGISKDWILNGTGEMEIESIKKPQPQSEIEIFRDKALTAYEKLVDRLEGEIDRLRLENERLKSNKD